MRFAVTKGPQHSGSENTWRFHGLFMTIDAQRRKMATITLRDPTHCSIAWFRRSFSLRPFVMWQMHYGKVLQLWDSNVLSNDTEASQTDTCDGELHKLTHSLSLSY